DPPPPHAERSAIATRMHAVRVDGPGRARDMAEPPWSLFHRDWSAARNGNAIRTGRNGGSCELLGATRCKRPPTGLLSGGRSGDPASLEWDAACAVLRRPVVHRADACPYRALNAPWPGRVDEEVSRPDRRRGGRGARCLAHRK